jgi:hypothetical protein
MGEMAVLDRTGDSRLQWKKTDPDEIAAALARFNELKGKGYAAFKVDDTGRKGEQITAFDSTAERLILIPPMVGG